MFYCNTEQQIEQMIAEAPKGLLVASTERLAKAEPVQGKPLFRL